MSSGVIAAAGSGALQTQVTVGFANITYGSTYGYRRAGYSRFVTISSTVGEALPANITINGVTMLHPNVYWQVQLGATVFAIETIPSLYNVGGVDYNANAPTSAYLTNLTANAYTFVPDVFSGLRLQPFDPTSGVYAWGATHEKRSVASDSADNLMGETAGAVKVLTWEGVS